MSAPGDWRDPRPAVIAWLRRIFGGGATAQRRPDGEDAARSTAAAAAEPPAGSFGIRRPLIGRGGEVAAFEFLLPAAAQARVAQRTDAAVAHHLALMASAAPLAAAGRAAVLRLPAPLLERPALVGGVPSGSLLVVDDLASLAAETARDLRARGVRLGTTDRPPSAHPVVDFVLLDAGGGIDTLQLSAQRWQEACPGLTLVATGLAHLDDVERVLRGGVHLAGGQLGRSAQPFAARELGSAAHRICELLNHLALDRDTAVIAGAVRADVALTYRLLRYANSAAIGLRSAAESVDRAVQVLGRAELHRWLSMQLMSAAEARQATPALQENALARGRLLENLARSRAEARPESLFTVGLLSRLDLLLRQPLTAVVEPLRLSAEARDALLRREGPWAMYPAVADELEGDDEARLAASSEAFGGIAAVLSQAESAWAWAAEVARTQRAG